MDDRGVFEQLDALLEALLVADVSRADGGTCDELLGSARKVRGRVETQRSPSRTRRRAAA